MPSAVLPYLPAAVASAVLLLVWWVAKRKPKFRLARRHRPGDGHQGPVWRSVLAWFAVALVVGGGAGAGLLWSLGWPKLPRGVAFSTTEALDVLKIGLAVVAGFGGVVALAVNYRRQRVTEAAHVLTISQEERERTKLFNERFATTTAQLGHDQAAVRIAGVYALAGLADDWTAQRQTCVDVLCAYLRLPRERDEGEKEVVGTIFRVLRTHLGSPHEAGPWSDLDFDFTGVVFHEADFSEITFEGRVVFDGAVFRGPHTSFERTVFRDMTLSCHGTTFTSDQVSFRHALFDHATVEFVGTDFTGTSIDFAASGIRSRTVDFYRATLTDARIGFRSSEVAGTTIRFERCAVTGSRLDFSYLYPDLEARRSVSRLVLEGCTVQRSEVDLRGIAPDGTDVWFTDSSFQEVEVLADKRSDGTVLKVRRVEWVDSTLPGAATGRDRPST
ncbi:pentapeptide repeat-containing protein [Saccharothrix saharensis]|uniref:pentapeptide repeat-containing protein n=1 Tax=Saccharothrix saharensis TaxID=571190 RepID=UPI0036879BA2